MCSKRLRRLASGRWRSVGSLFAVLMLFVLLTDSNGFLSTDVGGKVATLEAMSQRGDLVPDLGYWAEEADPDGDLYPMWSTSHVDDKWVNVTSLPMLYLALPLYRFGGAKLAGLLPVLGTVLAALGAKRLVEDLDGQGDVAFWVVGLASPATIYALDLWEHSLGLACMVWAVSFSLRSSRRTGHAVDALLAGLLFGVAATMRQEAIIYGVVAGLMLMLRFARSRDGRALAARGVLMSGAFVAVAAVNAVVEDLVLGGAARAGRGAGTAVAAGRDVGVRLREAIMTFGSPSASADTGSILVAVILVGLMVELGRRALRPDQADQADHSTLRPILIALTFIVAATALDLAIDGLRFIPGMVATTPVAALGLTGLSSSSDRRFVGAVALGSLPLVWAVQYTGGAAPQWGGRYILLSGTLLVVIAVASFSTPLARRVLGGVAIAGLAVTMLGVAWTVHRTHSFATAMETLAHHDPDVLVFSDSHLARDGGALAYGAPWLAAQYEDGRKAAAEVLERLGITEIGFVQRDTGEPPFVIPGWTVVERQRVPLVSGFSLLVTTQTSPP